MKRDLYIDQRLKHWAYWRLVSFGGRYQGVSFEYEPCRHLSGTYYDNTADDEIKGLEMDRAIALLPKELFKTVVAVYTWEGGLDQVVRIFNVTRMTIHRRLCNADIRLLDYLNEKYQDICLIADKNNFGIYTR